MDTNPRPADHSAARKCTATAPAISDAVACLPAPRCCTCSKETSAAASTLAHRRYSLCDRPTRTASDRRHCRIIRRQRLSSRPRAHAMHAPSASGLRHGDTAEGRQKLLPRATVTNAPASAGLDVRSMAAVRAPFRQTAAGRCILTPPGLGVYVSDQRGWLLWRPIGAYRQGIRPDTDV